MTHTFENDVRQASFTFTLSLSHLSLPLPTSTHTHTHNTLSHLPLVPQSRGPVTQICCTLARRHGQHGAKRDVCGVQATDGKEPQPASCHPFSLHLTNILNIVFIFTSSSYFALQAHTAKLDSTACQTLSMRSHAPQRCFAITQKFLLRHQSNIHNMHSHLTLAHTHTHTHTHITLLNQPQTRTSERQWALPARAPFCVGRKLFLNLVRSFFSPFLFFSRLVRHVRCATLDCDSIESTGLVRGRGQNKSCA